MGIGAQGSESGGAMNTIRRILSYNSQRRPGVMVNGHVHSSIMAIAIVSPMIYMSIRDRYPGVLVALSFLYLVGMWLLTEWHLYHVGHDLGWNESEMPRRDRIRMMLWVVFDWSLVMLAIFVAYQFR